MVGLHSGRDYYPSGRGTKSSSIRETPLMLLGGIADAALETRISGLVAWQTVF
jgi:hypothetical protein